jgi:hypothetical protein
MKNNDEMFSGFKQTFLHNSLWSGLVCCCFVFLSPFGIFLSNKTLPGERKGNSKGQKLFIRENRQLRPRRVTPNEICHHPLMAPASDAVIFFAHFSGCEFPNPRASKLQSPC